jgi:hypothetical protein
VSVERRRRPAVAPARKASPATLDRGESPRIVNGLLRKPVGTLSIHGLKPMTDQSARRAIAGFVAVLAFALSAGACAETSAKQEIDHLLDFVAASSCTFVRNGTEYPADKARDHLASKYQFAGSRITTAEEFIKYLATESSMSGELYHVKCKGVDKLSGVWLADELTRFRKASAPVQAAR